ncbi:MAG: ATP-binding protein [Bacilli bacterium]
MNELSLYLLDITQNSIKAQAKVVQINIEENLNKNLLSIDIVDDGCGMSKEVVSKVSDPFYTTRTTRKVGLGIPLLKELCELCCGTFSIESEVNKGTTLKCTFVYDNIDLPPFGDLPETIYTLAINEENVEIIYNHRYVDKEGNVKEFCFNTIEIKQILDGVSLKEYDVMVWIKSYITEFLETIRS